MILTSRELIQIQKTHRYEIRFDDPFVLWEFVEKYSNHFDCSLKSHGRVLYFEFENDSNLAKMLK